MEIDPEFIKYLEIDYLAKSQISEKANDFLQMYYSEYHHIDDPVVPIDEILDLRMKVNLAPWPGLQSKNKYESDGLLFYDAEPSKCTVYYDSQYDRPGKSDVRFRFTLAHEIGHWYLHSYVYETLKSISIEEFIRKYTYLANNRKYNSLEIQANIFASFVLIPQKALHYWFMYLLKEKQDGINNEIQKERGVEGQIESVLEFLSENIAGIFNVSKQAARSAIKREDLMDSVWSEFFS